MIRQVVTATAGLYGAGLGLHYLAARGHPPMGLRAVKPVLNGPCDPAVLSMHHAVENAFGLAFISIGMGLCYAAWRKRQWSAPLATLLALCGASFGLALLDSASYFGLLDRWGWRAGALFLIAAVLGVATLLVSNTPRGAIAPKQRA